MLNVFVEGMFKKMFKIIYIWFGSIHKTIIIQQQKTSSKNYVKTMIEEIQTRNIHPKYIKVILFIRKSANTISNFSILFINL